MKTSVATLRSQTPNEMMAQINCAMDEAEALLVGPFFQSAQDKFAELKFRLDLEEAQARLAQICEIARAKVGEGARQADSAIRSHPYKSLLIALGVGVLLGACVGCSPR